MPPNPQLTHSWQPVWFSNLSRVLHSLHKDARQLHGSQAQNDRVAPGARLPNPTPGGSQDDQAQRARAEPRPDREPGLREAAPAHPQRRLRQEDVQGEHSRPRGQLHPVPPRHDSTATTAYAPRQQCQPRLFAAEPGRLEHFGLFQLAGSVLQPFGQWCRRRADAVSRGFHGTTNAVRQQQLR